MLAFPFFADNQGVNRRFGFTFDSQHCHRIIGRLLGQAGEPGADRVLLEGHFLTRGK